MFDFKRSHRRFNPLTREWVLVSPQRTARPWQGQQETPQLATRARYDPDCYLCPGNQRSGGVRNPEYEGTLVFANDFPALTPETSSQHFNENDLIVAEGEPGICRVICFSPRHDLTVAGMEIAEVRRVIDTWIEQYQELGSLPFINWVQIFENQGAMMGASNPHPHCQIWANAEAPNELRKESDAQFAYRERHGSCLLCDYANLEMASAERLVCSNEGFLALVPFWAVWPFEILVISRRHLSALDEMSAPEKDQLADILRAITRRYDNLFQTPFPYSMGFHQRPTNDASHPEWHLHAHYYPPLLRSATVRKFMVGYELLASPQRDLTPEQAAEILRSAV